MTPAALAAAHLDQAAADLRRAEKALAKAMRKAGISVPWYATAAEVSTWRVVEARLEHPAPADAPLACAHADFCRARRAEAKAKSAAHRASWADAPRTAPVIRQDEGLDAAEVYRRLRELRAERVAA